MPYKDRAERNAYQAEWRRQRRLDWVAANGPCVDCGSVDSPEVDHADASQKVSHRVWSWSAERREAELAKCVVRCHDCHERKSTVSRDRGIKPSKLTFEQVGEIRRRRAEGEMTKPLAEEYGVSTRYVRQLVAGEWRKIA